MDSSLQILLHVIFLMITRKFENCRVNQYSPPKNICKTVFRISVYILFPVQTAVLIFKLFTVISSLDCLVVHALQKPDCEICGLNLNAIA